MLLLILLAVCGCEQVDPTADQVIFYSSDRFALLDTTRYILIKQILPLEPMNEAYLNWEQSFGEPYIDLNGNGIFDVTVDSLIDLNGNAIYDSPESTWTVGIPFDDINGDGVCQQWPGSIHTAFQSQLPYADYNLNQIRDSVTEYRYTMARMRRSNFSSQGPLFGYFVVDSTHHFLSDSGIHYYLPHNPILSDVPVGSFNLQISDTAFHFYGNGVQLEVFKRGVITQNVWEEYVVLQSWWPDQTIMTRSIETDASLTIDDTVYHQLVHVRFDNGRRMDPVPYDPTPSYFYDFYFAAGRGLLSISWLDRFTMGSYIYNNRYDTLPLPMTR